VAKINPYANSKSSQGDLEISSSGKLSNSLKNKELSFDLLTNSQIQVQDLQADSITLEELIKEGNSNTNQTDRDSILRSKKSLDQLKLARA
jgi:hypothetical protein